MKKVITLSESDLISLIEKVILTEKHEVKEFNKFVEYAQKHLKSKVIIKNNKCKFCPESSDSCYISHPEDKSLHDIFRFYSKIYNIPKQQIEMAFKNNRSLNIK